MVVLYFEDGGVVRTLKMVLLYFEDGGTRWCTLIRVVVYFEEGGVVL